MSFSHNSGMPNVHHPSAPKFDGKPISLSSYLDEVEQLASNYNLSVQETIQWSIRYLSPEDQQLWKLLPSSKGSDWDTFKAELFELYPGASEERRYTISNLEALVEKQAEFNITNSEQFGIYYRSFYVMASYLKAKKKLDDSEISRLFIQGLHPSFRKQVRSQLHAENPTHHPDDPFSLSETRQVALFVLSCRHGDSVQPPSQSTPEPIIKAKNFNPQSYNSLTATTPSLVDAITKQIEPLIQNKGLFSDNIPKQVLHKNYSCAFCSDADHYIPDCDVAEEYIQQGMCKRNSANWIVLPNGMPITSQTAPGSNLQERIDNWHELNRPKVTSISSNFVSIVATQKIDQPQLIHPQIISNSLKTLEEPADFALVTMQDFQELQRLEELVISTQKRIDEIRKKIGIKDEGAPSSFDQVPAGSVSNSKTIGSEIVAQNQCHLGGLSHSQMEGALVVEISSLSDPCTVNEDPLPLDKAKCSATAPEEKRPDTFHAIEKRGKLSTEAVATQRIQHTNFSTKGKAKIGPPVRIHQVIDAATVNGLSNQTNKINSTDSNTGAKPSSPTRYQHRRPQMTARDF